MSKKYLDMFNKFFNKPRMASTYKPVFLRSLLDIGDLADPAKAEKLVGAADWLERRDGKIIVDLNFIAVRFAKYYWDMEYSFHLRQSQDRQDANITRLIKSVHDPEKKPPTVEDLVKNDMKEFRAKVIRRSLKPEVLDHLDKSMPKLYVEKTKTIELNEDVIKFFHTHKTVLKKGLNNITAKYLEKLNRLTPQISNKLESDQKQRTLLNAEHQLAMNKWQDSQCFYCSEGLEESHVDHVIPFNYIFSTELYNCVLACPNCNCTKSDRLPEQDLFDGVLDRNAEISDYMLDIKLEYNPKSYQGLFNSCVIEYHKGNFFNPKAR